MHWTKVLTKNIAKCFYASSIKKIYDTIDEVPSILFLSVDDKIVELNSTQFKITEIFVDIPSSVVPYVIEPSIGIDRIIFALANNLLKGRTCDKNRVLFNLPLCIAPYNVAIYALSNNDELVSYVKTKLTFLDDIFSTYYDFSSVSIGKKYTRSDAIGIGLTITIDFDTLNDDTVTLRSSLTGLQNRYKLDELESNIKFLFIK